MVLNIKKSFDLYKVLLLLFIVSIYHQSVLNNTIVWKCIVISFCLISISKIIISKKISIDGYFKWILSLSIIMTFIGLISDYQQESLTYTKQFIKVAMFSYIIVNNCKNKKDIDFLLISIWIAGLTVVFSLIMNFDTDMVTAVETNLTSTRLGLGGIEHPNTTAYNIIISYVVGIYFIINNNRKQDQKLIFLIGQVLLIIGCILTGSRKVLITIVLLPLMIIIYKSKNPIKLFVSIAVMVILSSALYTFTQNNEALYNIIGHRIEDIGSILNGKDESAAGREQLIDEALQIGMNNPLGVGVNCFMFYSYDGAYAHNEYLEIFADLGLIGLLVYYVPILIILYKLLLRISKNKKLGSKDNTLYFYWAFLLVNILILEVFQITFNIFSYHIIISLFLSRKVFRNSSERINLEEYV